MIIRRLLRKNPHREAVESLYAEIMAQSRMPFFYQELYVPDTLDGRFELLTIHVFLVVHRLKQDPGREEIIRQLPEKMLHEIDLALRETGVSDMGVPRRVKTMAKAFLGRATVYETAMGNSDMDMLEAALGRNVFPEQEGDMPAIAGLAVYMRRAEAHLAALDGDRVFAGMVSFPGPGEKE